MKTINTPARGIVQPIVLFSTVCLMTWVVSVRGASPGHASEAKKSVAVMTLKNGSGISPSEAELITERLAVELFNTGKVNVMERSQMQEVLKEQGFQHSGACTDEACLVEMGQMLGVQYLVSGSIGKLGSLYMINVRVINVTTAQIAHVVSEDISGSIEQVVARLPAIARQLVTPTRSPTSKTEPEEKPAAARPEPTPQPVPTSPPPAPEKPPAPQPAPQTATVPAPATPAAETSDRRAERNRNRGGVRLTGTILLGIPKGEITDSGSSEEDLFERNRELYEGYFDSAGYQISHSRGSMAAQVVFMIPAGRFIAIDAGAGIRYFADIWEAQTYDDRKEDELRIYTPHLTTGLSFVYRFFPGKLNAGLVADIGLNILRYSFTDYDTAGGYYVRDTSDSWDDSAVRLNVAFGPRVGVEILAGPHVGFGLEFSYRFARITTGLNLWSSRDSATYTLFMPGVGLAFGLNFYF